MSYFQVHLNKQESILLHISISPQIPSKLPLFTPLSSLSPISSLWCQSDSLLTIGPAGNLQRESSKVAAGLRSCTLSVLRWPFFPRLPYVPQCLLKSARGGSYRFKLHLPTAFSLTQAFLQKLNLPLASTKSVICLCYWEQFKEECCQSPGTSVSSHILLLTCPGRAGTHASQQTRRRCGVDGYQRQHSIYQQQKVLLLHFAVDILTHNSRPATVQRYVVLLSSPVGMRHVSSSPFRSREMFQLCYSTTSLSLAWCHQRAQ